MEWNGMVYKTTKNFTTTDGGFNSKHLSKSTQHSVAIATVT